MPAEAVERAADELYRLSPTDFTKARDQVARDLRQEGLRDAASAVKALRKPTVAAWALNQLARRRPEEIERLLAAGKRLRAAQEALLAGGDRSGLQRASAEERELVDKLTRDATAVAGEAGTAGTGSLDERIHATLHAAALDEETAAELGAGRLLREREAAGLFGASPPRSAGTAPRAEKHQAPAEPRGRKEPRKVAERRRKLERELAAAKKEEQKTQRERAGAVKAAERAAERAREAQRRADEALKRATEAGAGLREAERRARAAAVAYDRAARAAASAEKKLG